MSALAPVGTPASGPRKPPLERFLSLFADVRTGETGTAMLLMLNLFLLLAAYYMLKPIREALIVAGRQGALTKTQTAAATAAVLAVLVPLYGMLAARVSRMKLINGVTLFFIMNLAVFFMLSRAHVPVGIPFYIWVSIFNVMIIAQLWAFANDLYTVDQGKRLFAIVGFGASLGAIVGSFFTGEFVKAYGPYPFMLAAAGLLALCLGVTNLINARESRLRRARESAPQAVAAIEAPAAGTGRNAFALVFADRYLLLIALLMTVYNLVNSNGEYIISDTFKRMAHDAFVHGQAGALGEREFYERILTSYYGNYQGMVSLVAALLQAFAVSRVLKYLGVRGALLVMPVIALGGYAALAIVPILSVIKFAKISENSLDYSVQNTVRNSLYLPTTREAKYKAKQANDTFFVRLGDVLAAGVITAGVTWLGFGAQQFALVNVALIALWLVLAVAIGRRFHQLAGAES